MGDDLVQRAHWGNLEGQNWADLARLSTEETEGEISSDATSEEAGPRFVTGRDIKSTEEQERDGRGFVESRGGQYVHTYVTPPRPVIRQRSAAYMSGGKPDQRGVLLHDSDFSIVATYQAEYRGLVQYYLLAQDVWRMNRLRWVMETSMLKTLAAKHNSTVTKMARKYKATVDSPDGPRKCFEVIVERGGEKNPLVARFGGIPLKRKRTAELIDVMPWTPNQLSSNELVKRLLADTCEICDSAKDVEAHHIRKLADLNRDGRPDCPTLIRIMVMRRRKTLVVCRACHVAIHAGRANFSYRKRSLESGVLGNQPAPFGKGPSEKDPTHGHLVGGLLHSSVGSGTASSTASSGNCRPGPTPRE
ncbi:group II intron reverse transcriptase/maturase [Streptomyces sp. NBC_01615]|uniref:group II intron reverse transcriptase/maturase n=1 Tax=Streptomyces sp. NBC_01615 TaxID=2975898 RepID=UPI00386CBB5C